MTHASHVCPCLELSISRQPLFTAGGALVGLAYYYFVRCPTGACPLTSNPFITMAYMGFIGWLLSGIFGKGCSGSCNTQ